MEKVYFFCVFVGANACVQEHVGPEVTEGHLPQLLSLSHTHCAHTRLFVCLLCFVDTGFHYVA